MNWFRYLRYPVTEGSPRFRIEYTPSNDAWRASLQLWHAWGRRRYWHVLFLPW